jgi:hypothetical protein
VASQRSRRKSRKRRREVGPRGSTAAPRPVASQRRERKAERDILAEREQRWADSSLKGYGERPQSPFGGLPISEFAIFAGAVALVVGVLQGGGPAIIAGLVVCALGVIEVTAREHFSGYRSHATLLAAIPAVGVVIGVSVAAHPTRQDRVLVLLAGVPVFALLFWLLRKRFREARQARVARPPAP